MRVAGVDINPISSLFARVKLCGFDPEKANSTLVRIVDAALSGVYYLPIKWDLKDYWFTPATLSKFEALRGAIRHFELHDSDEKAAVLLALCLAVRVCSRADQRSPKPFISKIARQERFGRHYDPLRETQDLLKLLATYYGSSTPKSAGYEFLIADIASKGVLVNRLPKHSHVITSPPYINAQDYFRNFKLELHVLEGLLPFKVSKLKDRFIGTERGNLLQAGQETQPYPLIERVPQFRRLQERSRRHANIVRRYFLDMSMAVENISDCLEPGGVMVVVCGDNLIAGERIKTWQILATMIEEAGFCLFDSFADPIKDRLLAPKRLGHKGLIKEEIVMAFRNPTLTPPFMGTQ